MHERCIKDFGGLILMWVLMKFVHGLGEWLMHTSEIIKCMRPKIFDCGFIILYLADHELSTTCIIYALLELTNGIWGSRTECGVMSLSRELILTSPSVPSIHPSLPCDMKQIMNRELFLCFDMSSSLSNSFRSDTLDQISIVTSNPACFIGSDILSASLRAPSSLPTSLYSTSPRCFTLFCWRGIAYCRLLSLLGMLSASSVADEKREEHLA